MMSFTMTLFLMSIKASVLIFVILIIKIIFNKLLNAKTHYLIWFLLFIVLTIPYSPQSSISIYNIPKYFGYNISSLYLEANESNFSSTSNLLNISKESTSINNITANNEENISIIKENKQRSNIKDKGIFNKIISIYESIECIKILSYVWLFGFLFLSLLVLINNIKFHKKIKSVQTDSDLREQVLLENCKNYLGIKKCVELIKINSLFSPSLIGIYKPRIILPKQIIRDFDNENLRYIILHELAHLERKDVLTNYFILIFQLVYWFNPIIWIGFYRMRIDMEIACDAFVLNNLREEQHISYGKVILKLLEYFSKGSFISVSTNIINYKREVKRRIIMIKKFYKSSCALSLAGLMLIALVGYSSISSAYAYDKATIVNEEVSNENVAGSENMIAIADAEKLLKNKTDILGRDYEYVRNIVGTPYIKTYYVNTKDLNTDVIIKNMPTEAIYPIESDEDISALYILFDKDKIVDLRIDEFSGHSSRVWKDSDYIVDTYSYELGSDLDEKDLPALEEIKDEFLNKQLFDFKEKFNLVHGGVEAYNKDETMQLSIYPIIGKNIPSPVEGVYILSENGNIKAIGLDRADIQFERLDEFFSLSNK